MLQASEFHLHVENTSFKSKREVNIRIAFNTGVCLLLLRPKHKVSKSVNAILVTANHLFLQHWSMVKSYIEPSF